MNLNSPRGTADVFGRDLEYRNYIIGESRKLFKLFNYEQLITPTFEYSEVFQRSIGQSTDIVQKEMYTFEDKKGRSVTLRPEGTASVVRAVIENKLYAQNLPLKVFYKGSMFRYERPQKGRMREFYQLGVEVLGSDNPLIDAEVIWLANLLFSQLGFKDLNLLINSIGCLDCRLDYMNLFRAAVKPKLKNFCKDCQQRFEKNPLRIFDCKNSQCIEQLENSPKIADNLCSSCQEHLGKVTGYLEQLNINFKLEPTLVRGFDYYTGTIFELTSGQLDSAQNALGGGGRYDNLVGQMGGPNLPAIGFAIGVDRTIILMKQLGIKPVLQKQSPKIYIAAMSDEFSSFVLNLLSCLRNYFTCDTNFNIKNIGKEIKWAQKNDFDFVIIIGEEEFRQNQVTIKDLRKYQQYECSWKDEKEKIIELLRGNK
ncbi:MAG: histidine--tRNA ligase [Actinomycetota bacterium]|nr:histidine--tRNA ligase [Actinomycetota bacterium]